MGEINEKDIKLADSKQEVLSDLELLKEEIKENKKYHELLNKIFDRIRELCEINKDKWLDAKKKISEISYNVTTGQTKRLSNDVEDLISLLT